MKYSRVSPLKIEQKKWHFRSISKSLDIVALKRVPNAVFFPEIADLKSKIAALDKPSSTRSNWRNL